jgi:hypothetical protein
MTKKCPDCGSELDVWAKPGQREVDRTKPLIKDYYCYTCKEWKKI